MAFKIGPGEASWIERASMPQQISEAALVRIVTQRVLS